MRTLAFSTILLTASLVVAPGCKKDDKAADDEAKKDDSGDAKSDDKEADEKPAEQANAGAGLAAAASKAGVELGSFPATVALIPEQAQFVVGLSPKSISQSPVYASVAGELEQDPDFKEVLGVFKECKVDPNSFDGLVFGFSMTEDFVVVMVGDGIGEAETASCVIKNIQKLNNDAQLADVVERDGKEIIEFTDGRAYLVDNRTLALATTAWQDTIGGLIDGSGTPAIAGSKKDLFAKVDSNASLWGLAEIPPEIAGMAAMFGAPPELSDVKNATVSVDFSSGASINLLAGFNSEDKAKAVATQLEAIVKQAAGEAPAEVKGMVESVKVETTGADLEISMTATMDQINAAKDATPPM